MKKELIEEGLISGPPSETQEDTVPPLPEIEEGQAEEGMISTPLNESAALEVDQGEAGELANRMIADAKSRIYGGEFDQFMEVLQGSDNIVEDIAMISLSLLSQQIQSIRNLKKEIPFDYMMDVSAEVVSEVFDMAVQTGVYQPSTDDELDRNMNISTTMVAGEMGKQMGSDNALPAGSVEQFIENVMSGQLDDMEANQIGMQQAVQPPPQLAQQPQGMITEEEL